MLAWMDAHDRLDTLMLEIRHLQTNIINSLRVPVLCRPLRFEERYLWPGAMAQRDDMATAASAEGARVDPSLAWIASMSRCGITPADLAQSWIIRYPGPEGRRDVDDAADNGHGRTGLAADDLSRRVRIQRQLCKRVAAVWRQRTWSLDQKRHYHGLRALQGIKSNVLKDKLTLAERALRAFGAGGLAGTGPVDDAG
jgi:hypothetical protein